MARLALAALVVILTLGGSAEAGNYVPPPGDYSAQWVTNGLLLVSGTKLVSAGGAPERVFAVPGIDSIARTDTAGTVPLVAFEGQTGGVSRLGISAPDGSQAHLFAFDGTPVAWVSQPLRLVFAEPGGRLASVRADGSGLAEYPKGVQGVPSPDGSRFAYVAGTDISWIHVVDADGRSDTRIDTGASPTWSPDGTRIAYWGGGLGGLGVARSRHSRRSFDIPGYVTNGSIVWSPDGRTIFGAGRSGLVGIDLVTGKRRAIAGIPLISHPTFSPNGEQLAYAAGGECRDRYGVYVANADGSSRRRVSNSCTITGSAGPDELHGDISQVVLGLGGDDTLYADDWYYFFDGDTLYGGAGNDRLYGGDAMDSLYGGPGNDILDGGAFRDLLVGGPGHDHIDGGPGNDVIGAQDGERDWITCGTSGKHSGVREHDVVYADRVDVVAADCEVVHRR
jgi:hypothetical protein